MFDAYERIVSGVGKDYAVSILEIWKCWHCRGVFSHIVSYLSGHLHSDWGRYKKSNELVVHVTISIIGYISKTKP